MTAPDGDGYDGPELDLSRMVRTLDRHGVQYVVVGGAAALGYGASRMTTDADCVPQHEPDNLERLAAAMRELNTRLRVEGMSDEQAKKLPHTIDGRTLSRAEIATWMTDAGALDILKDIPDRDGHPQRYEDLAARAQIVQTTDDVQLRVAGLGDIIASKEWAGRPKDHAALPELYALRDAQTAAPPPGE